MPELACKIIATWEWQFGRALYLPGFESELTREGVRGVLLEFKTRRRTIFSDEVKSTLPVFPNLFALKGDRHDC